MPNSLSDSPAAGGCWQLQSITDCQPFVSRDCRHGFCQFERAFAVDGVCERSAW